MLAQVPIPFRGSPERFFGVLGPLWRLSLDFVCGIAMQHACCKVVWLRNLQVFDPLELSKSSIFIERVIIFEGFDVLHSKGFFGPSWRPFWYFLWPSWALLEASWRHVGGSWGFKTGESDIRPHPCARDMRQDACQIPPGPPKDLQEAPPEAPKRPPKVK